MEHWAGFHLARGLSALCQWPSRAKSDPIVKITISGKAEDEELVRPAGPSTNGDFKVRIVPK